MGRRLRKKELLEEIKRERDLLDVVLEPIPKRLMKKPGVTRGGWSIKDILAHLVEWQEMNLNWYAAGMRGEKPDIPAHGYTVRDTPRLNYKIYRKHHLRPLQAIREEYLAYHQLMVNLIKTLQDADLITLGRYSWTGPSWTLSDYLRASTSAHYLWARTRIRRWLKKQNLKSNKKSSK